MSAAARPILGVVTIGQTPRRDLETLFAAAAPAAEVRVAGALDGLASTDIDALAVDGAYPLLVRLADGHTREMPRDSLVPRITAAARRLTDAGASVVVLACAGAFPPLACAVPLVVPGRIVPAVVRSAAGGGRVGIVTPNAAQRPFAAAKWRADGFDVVVTHAAPGRHDELDAAVAELAAAAVDLVVLDCMGHDEADRARAARRSGRPTVAAQQIVAGVAGALV